MPISSYTRALKPRIRTRAGAVTAGLCAAAVLAGGGVASAAGVTGDATAASKGVASLADTLRGEAELQEHMTDYHAKVSAEAKAEKAKAEKEKAEKEKAEKEKAEKEKAEKAKAEKEKAEKAKAEKAKKAKAKKAKGWAKPIEGDYTVSATFGNDGSRWAAGHSGRDFAVPTGTEVQSVGKGTVVKAGGNGAGDGPAYGNAIVIKHGNGTYSQYAHLSSVKVNVGEEVKAGETIALSGNTGNSSGPHLHFEIRTTPDYGSAVNPADFLRGKGVKV